MNILKKEDIKNYLISKNKNYKVQEWHKKTKRIFVFDCGGRRNQFFVLDPIKKQCFSISKQEFIDFPSKYPNATFIIEYAHLETRKIQSLAQPLSIEEKEIFYKNIKDNNICLKLFPEKKTPKARNFVLNKINDLVSKKSEKCDTISIYLYLKYVKNIFNTLSSKDNRHTSITEEAKEFRTQTNEILNAARSLDYKQDAISYLIENNKIYLFEKLSSDAKECFGMVKDKKGIKIKEHKYVYTILSTLLDREGNKRFRKSTKQPPGWSFIVNREFCLNSNTGGLSKSNLNRHFIPSYISREFKKKGVILKGKNLMQLSQKDYLHFIKMRSQIKKSIKEIFYLFKEILNSNSNQY